MLGHASVIGVLLAAAISLHAAAESFTYQGRLTQGGEALNGTADLQFGLFDDAGAGAAQIGPTLELLALTIEEGLITADLDFGPGAFDGGERWLAVSVRSPAGEGVFVTLAPRQPVMPAPYALHALNVAPSVMPFNFSGGDAIFTGGNVGIGTSSPGDVLDVAGGVRSTGASGGSLAAFNPGNQSANVSLSWLNDIARIRVGGTGAGAVNGLDIQSTGNVSLMRIFSNGHVGIGETSPQAPLHIQTTNLGVTSAMLGANNDAVIEAADARLRLYSNNAGSTGSAIVLSEILSGAVSDEWSLVRNTSQSGSALRFAHTDGTVMALTPAGNLGIGTSSPASELHVIGSDNIGVDAAVRIASGTQTMFLDGNEIDSDSSVGLYLNNNVGHDVILAAGGGRVGIGTNNPAAPLHVDGNVRVDGTITTAATERWLMIPATSFEHEDDFGDLDISLGSFVAPGLANTHSLGAERMAAASVQLPHGAIVTDLTAWIFDVAPSQNLTVRLMRKSFGTGGVTAVVLQDVISSGSAGHQVQTTGNITSPTINNDAFIYWVDARFPSGTPVFDLELHAVKITYEITSPLP